MLLHITPDGTVLNRPPTFPAIPPGQLFPGAPHPPPGAYPQAPPPGLLSLQAQGYDPRSMADVPADYDAYQYMQRNGYDRSQVDMTYTSASPTYGSPPQDSRFAHSPPTQGLSVLDAPLPNSFDSNGISMAARNGPFAASVPSRFGVESPPASLPRKQQLGNTTLRDLHNSAFGGRAVDGMLASSPPGGPDEAEPLTFPKRPLHSERLRAPRAPMISASLGNRLPTQSFDYPSDEENDSEREGDLLPKSLHDLIPEPRVKKETPRSSMEDENRPSLFLTNQRRAISGHGTPYDSKSMNSYSSSPSRFTSMWRSHSGRGDGEGVIGSPLRHESAYFPTTDSRANGDLSPTVNSPPRQASMSMLTKELQRTKLDAANSQAGAVGMVRTASNGSTGRTSLDRAMSSNSVGRERIDEEQELFDMDEVVDGSRTAPRPITTATTHSNPWNANGLSNSPSFGAIGGHRTTK
jgi:hypothetical protein